MSGTHNKTIRNDTHVYNSWIQEQKDHWLQQAQSIGTTNKNTVFVMLRSCHAIYNILKLVLHYFLQLCYACESSRCLDVEVYDFGG